MISLVLTKYKSILLDVLFVITCFISLFLYYHVFGNISISNSLLYTIQITGGFAIGIIIIRCIPYKNVEDIQIYKNKITIIPFSIIYLFLIAMIYVINKYFGLNNSTANNSDFMKYIVLYLILNLALLICYIFKIKLKYFKWKIDLKDLIMVLMVYIFIISFEYGSAILGGKINFINIFNVKFLEKFILQTIGNSIYPGIFEEVLYRGMLISGLKGFGLSDENSNIIQAVLFGISHVMSWGTASWIFLLHTSAQAIAGYVLGKLYLKTKSLTPCILLHGLMDAIM